MKILAALTVSILLASGLFACKVPVFRFALERWPADNFRLLVTSNGPLDEALRSELDALQTSLATTPRPVNLELEIIDLATLTEAQRASIPGLEQIGAAPTLTLMPPESWRSQEPAWSGAATAENLALVLDSPARQRCLARLLEGESTVWVVIPSGDEAQDAAALEMINAGLEEASSTIKIPEGVIRREDLNEGLQNIDLDDVLRSDLPLKISFVTETLSRDDPAEAIFLATLLGPAPPKTAEPLIVPIFGRGRTPGPVPISRLTTERVVAACEFLCGECSCQVKSGNPGFDLLFQADWDEHLNATILSADSELVQRSLDVVSFGPAEEAPPPNDSRPFRALLIGGITLAVLIIAGAFVLIVRKPVRGGS